MDKMETKIFVRTEEGEKVMEIAELGIYAFQGLYGQATRKLHIEADFMDRTDDKADVRIKHVELKILSRHHQYQEMLVKMILGMLDLYFEPNEINLTHTLLQPKEE